MNKIRIISLSVITATFLFLFFIHALAGDTNARNGFSLSASPSLTSEYDVVVEGPLPVVFVCVKTSGTGDTRFEKPQISKTGADYRWVFRVPPAKPGKLTISFAAKDPYYPEDVNARPEITYVSQAFDLADGGKNENNIDNIKEKDDRSEIQKLRDAVEASNKKNGGGKYGTYPRPEGDNRFGIHWYPTLSQPREEVDKFVEKIKLMNIKWVLFLNGKDDLDGNRYLVEKLVSAKIMPVMRIYYETIKPSDKGELETLKKLVKQYKTLGVSYYQIYNEPNLECEWEGDKFPENSVKLFADAFVPRAKAVLDAGGIPGIPGPAPGYYDTDGKIKDGADYFKYMIDELIARGERGLASKCFVALHNYATSRDPLQDSDRGFREFVKYREIMTRHALDIPQIGCEGGTRPEDTGGDLDKMAEWVIHGYESMKDAPDYFFCFSPWLLTAPAGNGWENHAWIKPDGKELPVVRKLIDIKN